MPDEETFREFQILSKIVWLERDIAGDELTDYFLNEVAIFQSSQYRQLMAPLIGRRIFKSEEDKK